MSEAPPEAFGPYAVYEQLGVGGMASVHRAVVAGIEGFERPVALKRMLPHVAANRDLVKAFVREARLASYLRHANVAQTYDLGKVGDIYFIAMELVTGRTLREVLRHCASTTGPMPVPIALAILNQLCDALDYAHNLCDESGRPLGIIHRDVSPSNIIVAEGGVVKLIDFGIAKASVAGMTTQSGTIKGKFGYMAPEYLEGRIDARADLFALGVIAHELLTNRALFGGGDDRQTLDRVRSMPIEPPSSRNSQVPPEIDDIVMTALARDPDRRWQHATALRTAMTTLTKRLGLDVHHLQVIQWIDWAFDQTQPRGPRVRRGDGPAHDDLAAASPSTSERITVVARGGGPDRPGPSDSVTPEEPHGAGAAYAPHAWPVVAGRAPDELMPTRVRASLPRLEAQVRATPPVLDPPPSPGRANEPERAPAAVVAGTRDLDPGAPRPRLLRSALHIDTTMIDGAVGPSKQLRSPPADRPDQPLAPPAPVPPVAPRAKRGAAWTMVLVLFAAALVAVAVYFVLPLLT